MKFGVVTYPLNHPEANLGDDIQAVAAAMFLPRLDEFLHREHLDSYTQDIFAIINGWYMHHPENFPPSSSIQSLITSIHISPSAANELLNEGTLDYFRSHEPVGCRDLYTRDLLLQRGVQAYFSSCLTLTLDKKDFESGSPTTDEVLLVDAFYRYTPRTGLKTLIQHMVYERLVRKRLVFRLLSPDSRESIHFASHFLGLPSASPKHRFELAKQLLARYAAARLVITSRLHAAMPCLAFGTPVLFLTENPHDPRFQGNLDFMNVLTMSQVKELKESGVWEFGGKRVRWNEMRNPDRHYELRSNLISEVNKAVQSTVKSRS